MPAAHVLHRSFTCGCWSAGGEGRGGLGVGRVPWGESALSWRLASLLCVSGGGGDGLPAPRRQRGRRGLGCAVVDGDQAGHGYRPNDAFTLS
jgi:hypothetical protein